MKTVKSADGQEKIVEEIIGKDGKKIIIEKVVAKDGTVEVTTKDAKGKVISHQRGKMTEDGKVVPNFLSKEEEAAVE